MPLPVSGSIWLHLPMDGHQVWFVTQALSCLFALLLPAPGLLLPWVLLNLFVVSALPVQLCRMVVVLLLVAPAPCHLEVEQVVAEEVGLHLHPPTCLPRIGGI